MIIKYHVYLNWYRLGDSNPTASRQKMPWQNGCDIYNSRSKKNNQPHIPSKLGPNFPAPHLSRTPRCPPAPARRSQHVAVLLRAPQLRGGPRLQGRLRGAVLRQLQQLHRGLRRRGHRGGRGAANVDGSGGAAEGEVLQLRVGV